MTRCCLLFAALAAGAVSAPARAEDFRVETDVFVGNQKKPVAQSLTLFASGLIYDFPLAGSEEVTVFDPVRGRFVLLDPPRKVKTTLAGQDILQFTAALKAHAQEAKGAVAFAAQPQFERSVDEQTGWLTLSSSILTYRAKGQLPKHASIVETYRQFADWYARLNATRPGGLPPFARMELNQALAGRGWVPEEVELTVASTTPVVGKNLVLRSRHHFNWLLSSTDRQRIEDAGTQLVTFQAVSFQDYRAAATEEPKK